MLPGRAIDHTATGGLMTSEVNANEELGRRLKVVSVATMFPNPGDPMNGLFVEQRIRALGKKVDLVVFAAVPYFPLASLLIPRYRNRRKIPRTGEGPRIGDGPGYPIRFIRYLSVPKFLKPLDGVFLAASVLWHLLALKRKGFQPDVLDTHLAFPEGYACVLLKRWVGAPVTTVLRGHDINELPLFPGRGRQVRRALAGADRVFAVAAALIEEAENLGASSDRTRVSPNGVDTDRFTDGDPVEARRQLNLPSDRKIVLSIGYLVERKGFQHLLRALVHMGEEERRKILLVIMGGPGGDVYFKPELERIVEEEGLEDSVFFAGVRPQTELPLWYQACDVFSLMSAREGRPNVVIEALACGRPIVATRAWGIPELVTDGENGCLVPSPPTPAQASEALLRALEADWDKEALAQTVRSRSWDRVAEEMVTEMHAILG
jgi:glycosyltransferase involved in cell wall biosynthesis